MTLIKWKQVPQQCMFFALFFGSYATVHAAPKRTPATQPTKRAKAAPKGKASPSANRHISTPYINPRLLQPPPRNSAKVPWTEQGRKLRSKTYYIPLALLKYYIANLNVLAGQAAISPYFKNGKSAGFRVLHVRRGSFFKRIGIQSRDVIQRINGHTFTNPANALVAYNALLKATSFELFILRKGSLFRLFIIAKPKKTMAPRAPKSKPKPPTRRR